MKLQVVVKESGTVEVHSRTCKEIDWEGYFSDGLVEAANPFGAAIETTKGDEREALAEVLYFPCLAPGYESPEDGPRRGRRPRRRAVPFDPEEDADAAIIEACMGRKVVWKSEISGREEYGVLYEEGPHHYFVGNREITSFPHNHTAITNGEAGRRILNFVHRGDKTQGKCFRSVALESIVSVT